MAAYDHFSFIDQLAKRLLGEATAEGGKDALLKIEASVEAFKQERRASQKPLDPKSISYARTKMLDKLEEDWYWGQFERVELAYHILASQRTPGGFSIDNLAALALILKRTEITLKNRDGLLHWAHEIAFSAIPSRSKKEAEARAKQSKAALETAAKKRAKSAEHLEKIRKYIKEKGPRNAAQKLYKSLGISLSATEKLVSVAKKNPL